MAIVTRLRELQDKIVQRSPALAKTGFAAGPLSAGDQQIVTSLAGQAFTQAFIRTFRHCFRARRVPIWN